MRLFADVLAPATISIDNPRFLAFIPAAPTELSMMFDLVVGRVVDLRRDVDGGLRAQSTPRTRRWTGLPAWRASRRRPPAASSRAARSATSPRSSRPATPTAPHTAADGGAPLRVACTDETHSSVATAAAVMDVELLRVAPDGRGRMTGDGAGSRDRARGRRGALRRGRHRRDDEPRRDRRPGRHRRRLPGARRVDARRRGLRRRSARGAISPRPLRRDRARRLVHRRSAQVALRPVRLVRASLPAARAGPGRTHPARRLPRGGAGQRAQSRPTTRCT